MITLNILPPKNKKELKFIDVLTGTKDTIMLIFFGIILIAISLIGAKFFLKNHFNKTISQYSSSGVLDNESISEIQEFNKLINTSRKIQEGFRPWSSILVQIVNTTNDGIIFRRIEIQNNHVVKLLGTARKREDITEFKNTLDSSKLFKEFTIPLDILFQKENIQFSLNLNLNQ